jgi:hypothetical protein
MVGSHLMWVGGVRGGVRGVDGGMVYRRGYGVLGMDGERRDVLAMAD